MAVGDATQGSQMFIPTEDSHLDDIENRQSAFLALEKEGVE